MTKIQKKRVHKNEIKSKTICFLKIAKVAANHKMNNKT